MPAKRKPTNEVKVTTVTVKLSKPEKEHLVKLCKSENLSKSEVVRRLLYFAEKTIELEGLKMKSLEDFYILKPKMIESEGKKMIIFDKVYDMDTGNVEEQPVRG